MDRSYKGRSVSPLHVHLGGKTPVHLHVKPRKKQRISRLEMQEMSCSAMAAGKPGIRAQSRSPSRSTRSVRVQDSTEMSSKHSAWVSTGKSHRPPSRMTWEGGNHRLEIQPNMSGSTLVHLSDFSDDQDDNGGGAPDIIVESGDNDYQHKMKSLQAEMESIRAKVELEKSMRELEEKDAVLKTTHETLKKKEAELSNYKECLLDSELENLKLKVSLSRQTSPERSVSAPPTRERSSSANRERSINSSFKDYDEAQRREELIVQLSKVENESISVMNSAQKVKSALKKLQKDRRFVSVHASSLLETKETFLESLNQFESMNRSLRRMIRDQQLHQSTLGQTKDQCDHLQRKLIQMEGANGLLKDQLQEQERMLNHSQHLHDEIGVKEGEIQTLQIRLEALEDQLKARHEDYCQLQQTYVEAKEQWYRDKDSLKKINKQTKEKLSQAQARIDNLTEQLHDMNSELSHEKALVAKLTHEDDKHRKELASFKNTVMDLEASLSQVHMSSKASVDAITSQLNDKMRALNLCQVEMDKLQTQVTSLQAKLQTSENSHLTKVSGLEADLSTLRGRLSHYEELVNEYKSQLSRSRSDQEELARELRHKEQEMDRYKRDSMAESEKCRMKLEQQLAELEPLPDMLKSSEGQLSEAQEKMMMQEQRLSDQSRMLAELRSRVDQSNTTIDSYKERLHSASVDRKSLEAKLAAAEQRQAEVEEQSREMMAISGKKEEVVQRLQHRIEEQVQEIATLSAQVESIRVDSRRQVEQAKDRAAGKERTHLARISDLETQLGRANNLATQFRKSKEDLDRRYHSRVNELTERLDQAHSTKRSLENYITFLKSSYASVFSESGNHAPGSPLPPPSTFT